jgi:hypothetical protein
MPIIFNELEYAENLLEKGFQEYIGWSDLKILSAYFRYKGQKNPQIKKSIVEFYKLFSYYNEQIIGEKIDNAIKKSEKYALRISTSAIITKGEIEKIRALKNYKLEKICFAMIALSRANKIAYNSSSSRYYLSMNFAEILEIANVRANKNGRKELKYSLSNGSMVRAPKVNRMAPFNSREIHEIIFIDENSGSGIIVTDLDNIISFYPQKCILCGKEMPDIKRGKRSNLCDKCYETKRLKRIR